MLPDDDDPGWSSSENDFVALVGENKNTKTKKEIFMANHLNAERMQRWCAKQTVVALKGQSGVEKVQMERERIENYRRSS